MEIEQNSSNYFILLNLLGKLFDEYIYYNIAQIYF